MAKKFVRGITDIKNIEHQDFDTNNVNDLLSDGEHSYIHRKKKDGSEEYHNLTNNIKTIEAEDNGLLTVRNYNNSKNSAKLEVHHDSQKEQKLYSTDHTIEIVRGDNGTGEFTNIDVDPSKILEIVAGSFQDYVATDTGTGTETGFLQTLIRPLNGNYNQYTMTIRLNKGNNQRCFYHLNQNDYTVIYYIFSNYGLYNSSDNSHQINLNNAILSLYSDASLEYYNNSGGVNYNHFFTTFSMTIPKNLPQPPQNQASNTQE